MWRTLTELQEYRTMLLPQKASRTLFKCHPTGCWRESNSLHNKLVQYLCPIHATLVRTASDRDCGCLVHCQRVCAEGHQSIRTNFTKKKSSLRYSAWKVTHNSLHTCPTWFEELPLGDLPFVPCMQLLDSIRNQPTTAYNRNPASLKLSIVSCFFCFFIC